MIHTFQAPPVHLVLGSYPPTPARVGLWYRPLPLRLCAASLALAFFWGLIPWSVWVPPHYPWPILLFGAGAYSAYWLTRSYRVRWFAGQCPRCGHDLHLPRGTAISLPYAVTCFQCHFEPCLDTFTDAEEEWLAVDERRHLRHARSECTGTWREVEIWRQPYLTCTACGVRHHATPTLREAAELENETGRLLDELADEGRYLC